MNPGVDKYLIDGCMRCKYGGTPDCKVHLWTAELETLRRLVLECELTEEIKWGVPCYTVENKNILMISAFKEFSCLSFFKGALMKDPYHILLKPGESSQSVRLLKFTDPKQITGQWEIIKSYIREAIELEKEGKKVEFKKNLESIPEELLNKFSEDSILENAFYALTPGKQRGYIIYFSQPKNSLSRESRINKCREKILNGEGFHDKYKC